MARPSNFFKNVAKIGLLTTTLTGMSVEAGGSQGPQTNNQDAAQNVGITGNGNHVRQNITQRTKDCSGKGNCNTTKIDDHSRQITNNKIDNSYRYRDESVKVRTGSKSDATAIAKGGRVGDIDVEGSRSNSTSKVGNVSTGDVDVKTGDVNVAGDAPVTQTVNEAPVNVNSTNNSVADGRSLSGYVNTNPTGNCGSGWGISLNASQFAGDAGSIGFSNTNQDETCMTKEAGTAVLNSGVVTRDPAMQAAGLATLGKTFEQVQEGIDQVAENISDCGVNTSPVLLASKNGCNKPAVK